VTASAGAKISVLQIQDSEPLNIGPIGCRDTSIRNHHYLLRNNTEERSSYFSAFFFLLPVFRLNKPFKCMFDQGGF
jgi:hypothetical protein